MICCLVGNAVFSFEAGMLPLIHLAIVPFLLSEVLPKVFLLIAVFQQAKSKRFGPSISNCERRRFFLSTRM